MKHFALPAAALACLLLAQCKTHEPDPVDPLSQLPPATQTGANTFGCLVNGQAYTPAGRVGLGSNFDVNYDPTYLGGDLIVGTYSADASTKKYLTVGGEQVSRTGTYYFGANTTLRTFFTDDSRQAPCNDFDNRTTGTYSRGRLTITRLDKQAGIVSGTFAFTLYQLGCDSLRVTAGRFDAKL